MSEKQMRLGALEAGGTKMVCAVVSGDGEVLDRMETPTLTPAETVPQMVEWFTARDVNALGIGAFGPTCGGSIGAVDDEPVIALLVGTFDEVDDAALARWGIGVFNAGA